MKRPNASRPISVLAVSASLLILLFALTAIGCSSSLRLTDDDIQDFLDEYAYKASMAQQKKSAMRDLGIDYARIENPDAPLPQRLVSVKLENAHLGRVIDRLGVDYVLDGLRSINGRVTASFERTRLQKALDLLTKPLQLEATVRNDIVVIRRAPSVPLYQGSTGDYIMMKYVFKFSDTHELDDVLSDLLDTESEGDEDDGDDSDSDEDSDDWSMSFSNLDGGSDGSDSSTNSEALSYTLLHAENAVLVTGPSSKVENALQIFEAFDTDTGHVLIEAMLLEFNADQLVEVGTRISEGAKDTFSQVNIDWSSLAGETISFMNLATDANATAFRAAISLMIDRNNARVIARPYLATVSGKPAFIEVAGEQYVTQQTGSSGEVTLEPVSAGVNMKVTPFVLPSERIRMDVDVELSRFVPSVRNAQLATNRSVSKSTVRVGSGEPLVIGGLSAGQSSRSSYGIPGLSDVPGLNMVFGVRPSSDFNKRVLIYITPYLWEPGIETPLQAQDELVRFMSDNPMGLRQTPE
jgi:hypothetical protein